MEREKRLEKERGRETERLEKERGRETKRENKTSREGVSGEKYRIIWERKKWEKQRKRTMR